MPPAHMDPMATPRAVASKHQSRARRRTRQEKEAVLEMFDLGLADQLARLDQAHDAKMSLFLARQAAELARIPLALRRLTVRELGEQWQADGLRGVMQRLAEVKLGKKPDDQTGALEDEMREGAAAKRKRTVTASTDGSADYPRAAKNPRTDPAPSTSAAASVGLKTPKATGAARRKKPAATTQLAAASSSATTSTVPTASTFQFHPLLPSTPLLKSTATGYRKPRRNESIVMSLNGSPLRLDELLRRMGGQGLDDAESVGNGEADGGRDDAASEQEGREEDRGAEEDDEDEDEDAGLGLLDEEEVMRQIEGSKGPVSRA